MKISVELDVSWDGQDEMSVSDQITAIVDMIKSGAESFNFDVHVGRMELGHKATAWVPNNDVEPKPKWENSCGSCRFMDTKEGRCTKRNIFIKDTSPSCPQWRYFA